jgi:hypothetical protein
MDWVPEFGKFYTYFAMPFGSIFSRDWMTAGYFLRYCPY